MDLGMSPIRLRCVTYKILDYITRKSSRNKYVGIHI